MDSNATDEWNERSNTTSRISSIREDYIYQWLVSFLNLHLNQSSFVEIFFYPEEMTQTIVNGEVCVYLELKQSVKNCKIPY